MDAFEKILSNGDTETLNKFYKNMRTMTKVQYNKAAYLKNITNILTLFDKIERPQQTIDYGKIGGYFTLKDYKDIFGNFRQTLMHARSKKAKKEKLLSLGSKVNALRRYYFEFE